MGVDSRQDAGMENTFGSGWAALSPAARLSQQQGGVRSAQRGSRTDSLAALPGKAGTRKGQ